MFVRFMVVFDLLFRIALWPSVGKELSPWLFTCAVFLFVFCFVWFFCLVLFVLFFVFLFCFFYYYYFYFSAS